MPGPSHPHLPSKNHPLAPHLYAIPGQACFFTIHCAAGTAPFINPQYVGIAVACLLQQRAKSHCQVDVYCVMPNHLHVVVTPQDEHISTLTYIERFKGWCSHELHRAGWHGDV